MNIILSPILWLYSLIFKRTATIIWLSILTIICFVFIRFTDTTPWMLEKLPHSRVLINMTSALILAFLGLIYYRFEQRFYERQLQQSQVILEKKNSELEESNTTKEKLFSIIAHDLRSPIAQLRNILDYWINKLLTPEEFNKLAEHISLNVKQLQGGLDNLCNGATVSCRVLKCIHKNRFKIYTTHRLFQWCRPR